jgi:hypothetical protein
MIDRRDMLKALAIAAIATWDGSKLVTAAAYAAGETLPVVVADEASGMVLLFAKVVSKAERRGGRWQYEIEIDQKTGERIPPEIWNELVV